MVASVLPECLCGSTNRLRLVLLLMIAWVFGLYLGSYTKLLSHRDFAIILRNKSGYNADNSARTRVLQGGSVGLSKVLAVDNQTTPQTAIVVSHTQGSNLTLKTTETSPAYVSKQQNVTKSCTFPVVDPFDPELEKYLSRKPTLNCSSYKDTIPNVVYLENHETIRVDHKKLVQILKNGTKFDHCEYHVIVMKKGSDKTALTALKRGTFNDSIPVNSTDQDIKIQCVDSNKKTISISYFSFIRPDPERSIQLDENYNKHIEEHKPVETLSILVMGIDAMAKQHFARSMPKTRDFLIKELGALELNKHNKLGYSTLPNVIAILTGRTVHEFMDDPKYNYSGRGSWDLLSDEFIWTDAAKRGYRTGLIFDEKEITAFHYLRPGFPKKPVDHYMRPMVVMSKQDKLMRAKGNCYGDEEEVTKLSDYWLQMARTYNSTHSSRTPYFAYSFFARLTHDNLNNAFAGDELYYNFFKNLKATNALNNTVIVWFSDHGERYGRLRLQSPPHLRRGFLMPNTNQIDDLVFKPAQGVSCRPAERQRYLVLDNPINETKKFVNGCSGPHSHSIEDIMMNRHTYQGTIETNTPHTFFVFPLWFEKKYPDAMQVFKTNQDRLTSHWDTYATMKDLLDFKGVPGPKGNLSERGISLFREIPQERSCTDAQIPAEYCVCARFSKPKLSPGLDNYLGMIIRDKIMSILKPHIDKCAEIRLSSIENILEETETGSSEAGKRVFRVSIMTEPGYATFEAVVKFEIKKNAGKVEGDVARTNMYRGQADCMETADMRRYCYCKNLLKATKR